MAENPEVQNKQLDPETGEMVSKSELKRRQKQRVKDAHRAARPVPVRPAAAAAGPSEEDLDPRQYFELRSRAVKEMMSTKNPDPYPHKFEVTTDLRKMIKEYQGLGKGEQKTDVEVRIGARIYTKRQSGKSLVFYVVRAWGVKIQIVCQFFKSDTEDNSAEEEKFRELHESLRRGDIIGVVGCPGRTNPAKRPDGELSIFAKEVKLLAPCLHQLPSEHFGLKDHELRHRNKYLDLIMNDSVRNTFITRAKIVSYIRRYFDERDFIEVETPTMNSIAGGATAKPFLTHYNALASDVYMRVAPELFLKMLIVGGMERVYELGKQWRNEDLDLTHNPEFTTCEFYQAYADMYDVMNTTEELVSGLVKHVTGGYETKFHTQHGEEYSVNWERPWKRIEMMPAIQEVAKSVGETLPPNDQLHTDETNAVLRRVLEKVKLDCPPPLTNARMLDKLVGEYIEEKCVNPTFITGHPQMMSPLAKYHREIPGLCERFEAFVCKKEIANAYTELNDPFDQRQRFEEQARQKDQGDDEAQLIDETFCSSLEYALPPTGGWGMGIDRLVMFLTDHYSIRDVITFPMMKPERSGERVAETIG